MSEPPGPHSWLPANDSHKHPIAWYGRIVTVELETDTSAVVSQVIPLPVLSPQVDKQSQTNDNVARRSLPLSERSNPSKPAPSYPQVPRVLPWLDLLPRYRLSRIHHVLFSDLAPWPYPPVNMRQYFTIADQCVKVGGVLVGADTGLLCSMIHALTGVVPLGAYSVSKGVYVVALRNYQTDFGRLTKHTEKVWMGPHAAYWSTTHEEVEILANFLRSVRSSPDCCPFPRHTITFGYWSHLPLKSG